MSFTVRPSVHAAPHASIRTAGVLLTTLLVIVVAALIALAIATPVTLPRRDAVRPWLPAGAAVQRSAATHGH